MLFIWLVVIQLGIFAGLVFFLRNILTRNITSATSQLKEMNADYTQKLEDAKKQQAEAEKFYDDTLLRAKTDAEKAKVQILKEANENQDRIVKEARALSEDIIGQANRASETIRKEMDHLVHERSIDTACELLPEVLTGEFGKKAHAQWVEEFLASGFENLDRLHLPDTLEEVELISAYPLSAPEKNQVAKKIETKFKSNIRLLEKVDPTLVAGIKIRLGSVVIDASFKNKIQEVAKNAKRLDAK